MNARDQLNMSRYMEKQAMSYLGETGVEQGMNAFSMLPGVGFLGNLGSGIYNIGRGRFGRGMADIGMGAVSAVTGGASNYAMKGLRAGGMLARPMMKAIPSFTRAGVGTGRMLGGLGQSAVGRIKPLNAFANSGMGTFLKAKPMAGTVTSLGGNSYKTMESGSNMAPRNRAFDSMASTAGKGTSIMGSLGGETDPRNITPPSVPAPTSTMFS